jgi:hypothetical protein
MVPITKPSRDVVTFEIEGQTVRCLQSGQHRLWRCECDYFQRMLSKYSEGFCPHVAVAIGQAGQQGMIAVGNRCV